MTLPRMMGVLTCLVAACSGEASPPGGAGSGGTNGTLVYPKKGCASDPSVKPAPAVVTEGIPDAGTTTYCSCLGQTFEANRGFATVPWAYEGPCLPGIPVGRVCGAPGLADYWSFTSAGCDGEANVACVNGSSGFDSGLCLPVCTCEGRTGCDHRLPYAYVGGCRDGGVSD